MSDGIERAAKTFTWVNPTQARYLVIKDDDTLNEKVRASIKRHVWGGEDYPADEADCCAEEIVSLLRGLSVAQPEETNHAD